MKAFSTQKGPARRKLAWPPALLVLAGIFLLAPAPSRGGSIFDDDYAPPKRAEPAPKPQPAPVMPPVAPDKTPVPVPTPSPIAPPVAPVTGGSRSLIPDRASRAACRKLFEDVFAKELKDSTRDARKKFAQRLLDEGMKAQQGSADRFVLLAGARNAAIDAGDTESAIAADNELCGSLTVGVPRSRLDLFARLSKTARSRVTSAMLVRECIRDADEAEANGDYDTAKALLDAAVIAVNASESGTLLKQVTARQARISVLASAYDDVQKSLATLRTTPNEPVANLAVGRFYCLMLGRWSMGLKFLAAGSDPGFSAAAKADMGGDNPAAIAAGWATLAGQETGIAKRNLQLRAAKWYRDALGSQTGLQRLKTEHDLAALMSGPFLAGAKPLSLSNEQPPQTILSSRMGLVALGSASGHFEGGGESVGVSLSEDGSWRSECHSFQGKLLYTLIAYPQADGLGLNAEVKEYHWKRGEPKVKMIRRDEGFCFLSKIAGHFVGAAERVGVTIAPDGFWYLDCASGQDQLSAEAISVKPSAPRTFTTELREVTWKAGAPPVQVIQQEEGMCFLSIIKGGLWGHGDFVGLELNDDGFWYLRGSGHMVAAQAIVLHYLPETK